MVFESWEFNDLLFQSIKTQSRNKKVSQPNSAWLNGFTPDKIFISCELASFKTPKELMVDASPPDPGQTPSDLWWHWLMPIINWSKCTTWTPILEIFLSVEVQIICQNFVDTGRTTRSIEDFWTTFYPDRWSGTRIMNFLRICWICWFFIDVCAFHCWDLSNKEHSAYVTGLCVGGIQVWRDTINYKRLIPNLLYFI